MSWTSELYAVYEKAAALPSERVPLLPISHSTAKAQLEVTIDGDGNFIEAGSIEDEEDVVTIIPVTEDSGTRSSGVCPHPFADKLIYIAGDYCNYFSAKKEDGKKFETYILQLKKWRDSEFTHPSVNALYDYLSKGELIGDLIRTRVLNLDSSGKVAPDKIQNTAPSDCFVRFIVIGDSDEENTWKDKSLYEKFIEYNNSVQAQKALCYATGDQTYCTYKHPSKVLNAGDKGKLFSANDESGFSYRGRFLNKEQAVSIGYEFSQKMHNGLKWLIRRQGVSLGNLTLIVWNSSLGELPEVYADSRRLSVQKAEDTAAKADDAFPETFVSYKEMLQKSIFGGKNRITSDQKAMILILDEATTGRISVSMYGELPESEFLRNIEAWHSGTAWNRFDFKEKKNYIGSFSLPQIAEFAYGTEQNKRVTCKAEIKNDTVMRLIPCVTEGRRLPTDILRQLANRASRRSAYEDISWKPLLEITCGMVRKHYIDEGRDYGMALDKNCKNRSYLFGRLLAVAEAAEASTYDKSESGRATNAERFFEKFSNAPAATWAVIMQRLSPYFNGMSKGTRVYYQKIIDEIMSGFEHDDFCDNSKLDPEFLLAYSCQRKELYTKKQNDDSEEV